MAIFDENTLSAAEKMNKAKLKAAEFEGKGLVLKIKSSEKVKSQYGAESDASIVEKGILEEGEQFLFVFEDADGIERNFWTTSMPFFIGMQQAELNFGDWLHIRREGVKDKTRYYVEVVESPVSSKNPEDESLDEVNPF